MAEITPIELQEYLKGIEYPASKSQLKAQAEKQGAGQEILGLLGRLPDKEYSSPIEVSKSAGSFG